mgnify:FL=1
MNRVTHSMTPVSGLGNQMFQVASAVGYGIKHGHTPVFNIPKSPHEEDPIYIEHCFYSLNKESLSNPHLISETASSIYSSIPFVDGDVCLDGYFQSPKYFADEGYIRSLLSLSTQDDESIKKRYSDILKKDTVSIHIRRGDYLLESQKTIHPMLPAKYYKKALDEIEHDTVLCFSDDIKWCKKNLRFKNVFFVEGNTSWEDMHLMSLCNNNIISNSTFSWWAAFLNKNKNKRVIFPSRWFGDEYEHKTDDMFPSSWNSI